MRSRRWTVYALLACGLSLALLYALPEARAEDPPGAPAQKQASRVQIKRADRLRKEGSIYRLTGNIILVQDDVTMTMDQCDYNDADNTAVASGHLKIVDPEATLTGDSVEADFDQKLARVKGNVTIVTQRKKKEESTAGAGGSRSISEYREKKTTITCPQIDYYYADDKKQATVFGPVKAVQEDKTVYADKALYDGLKEEVVLDGNVRLLLENGSEFRCPQATISLNDDWIEARDIEGVAVEESKPEPPPAPPPPAENGGEAIPAAENGG